jgi:hypothetical protein
MTAHCALRRLAICSLLALLVSGAQYKREAVNDESPDAVAGCGLRAKLRNDRYVAVQSTKIIRIEDAAAPGGDYVIASECVNIRGTEWWAAGLEKSGRSSLDCVSTLAPVPLLSLAAILATPSKLPPHRIQSVGCSGQRKILSREPKRRRPHHVRHPTTRRGNTTTTCSVSHPSHTGPVTC